MSDYTPTPDESREMFIDGAVGAYIGEDFDRMIARVRAEEREKCAQIAESARYGDGSPARSTFLERLAARIRAQGEETSA